MENRIFADNPFRCVLDEIGMTTSSISKVVGIDEDMIDQMVKGNIPIHDMVLDYLSSRGIPRTLMKQRHEDWMECVAQHNSKRFYTRFEEREACIKQLDSENDGEEAV